MNNSKYHDQIDDYLAGNLSSEDKALFEEVLTTDTSLINALKLSELERDAMRLSYNDSLRTKMTQWKEEKITEASKNTKLVARSVKRRKLFSRLSIAASFLFIMGLTFYTWTNSNNSYNEAADYFDSSLNLQKRGEIDKLLTNEAANQNLASFDSDLLLVLGEKNFKEKNFEETISIYQLLLQRPINISIKHRVEWNLMLTYHAFQKIQDRDTLLDKIIMDKEHSYNASAREFKNNSDLKK